MGFRPVELAGQDFGPGDDYLKSIANQARKAYCSYVALDDSIPDIAGENTGLLSGLQREFVRSVCEMPEDPVALPPVNRAPSNQGKCQNVLYSVVSVVERGGGLGTDTFPTTVYGPIALEVRPFPSNPDFNIYVLTHNGRSGGPPGTIPREDVLTTARKDSGRGYIRSAVPAVTNPPQVDCARRTLPTDQTRRSPPTDTPRPNINIPIPNLPTVNLPVIPIPIPIPVGGTFSPSLVLDVGGINIVFTVGDVDINFSPTLNAPGTLVQPGFQQPSLPPGLDTFTYAGLIDCCDAIKAKVDGVAFQVTQADLKVQDVRDRVNSTLNYLTGAVTPLLEDIQECACPGEGELYASFNNLGGYQVIAEGRELLAASVQVVVGGDVRKRYEFPGAPTVSLCGWYSFGRAGRWGVRTPLNFEDNICVPEGKGFDSFAFGVTTGLQCNGSVIAKKLPEG